MEDNECSDYYEEETAGAMTSPHLAASWHSNGSHEAVSPSSAEPFSPTSNLFYDSSNVLHENQASSSPTNSLFNGNPVSFSSTSNLFFDSSLTNENQAPLANGYNHLRNDLDDENGNNHDIALYQPRAFFPREESEIRRRFNRRKALELQERNRASNAAQDDILEQAAKERKEFYQQRTDRLKSAKILNREKEKAYHENVDSQERAALVGNTWEMVVSLIDLEKEYNRPTSTKKLDATSSKTLDATSTKRLDATAMAKKFDGATDVAPQPAAARPIARPKSPAEILAARRLETKKPKETEKATKATDLARMKEILIKLKRTPLVR